MLRHIVLLQWQESVGESERTQMLDGLRELIEILPGVAASVVATNLELSPGSHDAALVVDFEDEAAWRSYQDNPAHKAFVAEHLAPNLSNRSAIQVAVADRG